MLDFLSRRENPTPFQRAIAAPAERIGITLEPQLVGEMVAEMLDQPGALPLLQYALTELFDRRVGSVVPAIAYREIGGVSGALARRASRLALAGPAVPKPNNTLKGFARLPVVAG